MARPREPIALIEAKGRKHLTKAEREARKTTEVVAPCDKIEPPAWLLKKEKEKFNGLAGQLIGIGVMSNLDCDVLARYVRCKTEYEKVTKQLTKIKFSPDKNSHLSKEEQLAGQVGKYNYLQKIQARLERQCNADARELGLTIASRCKLVAPQKEQMPKENKFLKHA